MPTPVGTARQCLTPEAAHALDEAVAVARSRGHVQTTSLHMVSSLLSLPSSALREACTHARKNAYSTRVQLKALELCLGVSLDRLASSRNRVDEPPVSNSLMAAIKRSQANQRRQPENFNFYQQQMQCASSLPSSSSAISVVKVELQNLILSVLDDPVVSRVFGEAGFRSCDIKLTILRPVHQLFKYSRYKGPPMFLCNLTDDSELSKRGFSFPFLGVSGVLDREENSRRIGEVMVRKKGRNPLLLGVCASDALKSFLELVQNGRGGDILPVELSGLEVIRVENEILRCVNGDYEEGLVKLRLDEVSRMVENCKGAGVVVNFGDLKALASDDVSVDALSCVIHGLGRLMEVHSGKVWIIGAAARHETYFKILNRYPSIEKDWDWQILPITTSIGPSMPEQSSRSSLTESFVPYGGFFSLPSEVRSPLSSSHQSVSRCHLCNKNCEQEINALSKGGVHATIVDQYHSSIPIRMQMTAHIDQSGLDTFQATDDTILPSTRIAGLQRKWDFACQHNHSGQVFPNSTISRLGCQIPSTVGFPSKEDRNENTINDKDHHKSASSTDGVHNRTRSCTSMDLLVVPTEKRSNQMNFLLEDNSTKFLPEGDENHSKTEDEFGGHGSSTLTSSSSAGNGHASPTSATSVTTDLVLGLNSACTSKELEKHMDQARSDPLQDNLGCFSANGDIVTGSISNLAARSAPGSCHRIDKQVDVKDFKMLYAALAERIGYQEEALSTISQTIVRCRTRNGKRQGPSRGDTWFNLHGPDILEKKKLAIALSQILCGGRENLTTVDLSFHDEMIHKNTLLGMHVLSKYDLTTRGKTVVDYIAEKLSKRPLSVVFIENIDKADVQVQSNMSQALRTGRFSDSHGREVGISNAIFVTTTGSTPWNKTQSSMKGTADYTEEDILTTKGWPIQIVIGFDLGDDAANGNLSMCTTPKKAGSDHLMNKRKLNGTIETLEQCRTAEVAKRAYKASDSYLDLNLPAEESQNSSFDSVIESSEWLEGFLGQSDAAVVLKPFNFDALAQEILMKVRECFNKIVIPECLLEIDRSVMAQILAAAYFTNIKNVEDWVHHVLSRGFAEAQQKYSLTARSILKLVTFQGIHFQDQTPPAFLPVTILLH